MIPMIAVLGIPHIMRLGSSLEAQANATELYIRTLPYLESAAANTSFKWMTCPGFVQ